jgi:HK97 family phage major capsid protein
MMAAMDEVKSMFEDLKKEATEQIRQEGEKLGKSADETAKKVSDMEEKLDAKLKEIDEKLRERRVSVPGSELPDNGKKFSFARAFRALTDQARKTSDPWKGAEHEKEILEAAEVQRAANNATDGTEGAVLVPEELDDQVIPMALEAMPIFSLGPTVMRNLVGNIAIPKTTGRPTGYWVGENEAPTESEATFGEIKLDPKRVAGFSKVSQRLLRQAPGVAEPIIRQELANALAIAWHDAIIRGSGSDSEPRGIVNTSGLTTTTALGTNGGRFTADKAEEMYTNIQEADYGGIGARMGMLMRPMVLSGMKRERIAQYSGDTGGQYVFAPPMISNKTLEDMVGMPIRTTTGLLATLTKGSSSTCSRVIMGDWAQLLLAMWGGVELKASDTTAHSTSSAFLQNQVWLVIQQECDVQIKQAAAFSVIADAETTPANW